MFDKTDNVVDSAEVTYIDARLAKGGGMGEGLGDATATSSGDGGSADAVQLHRGDGYGDDGLGDFTGKRGDADDLTLGFPSEIAKRFQPWTNTNILHAYAYMNATSQEEKDCIIGTLELTKEEYENAG